MQKRNRMLIPTLMIALMYGVFKNFVNDRRGEPGGARGMGTRVVAVVIGLVFVVVGVFFYTVLAPITANQIVSANTTAIALLPGGSGLVTLFKFVGTIFIIFGVIVFLGVLAALALGAL